MTDRTEADRIRAELQRIERELRRQASFSPRRAKLLARQRTLQAELRALVRAERAAREGRGRAGGRVRDPAGDGHPVRDPVTDDAEPEPDPADERETLQRDELPTKPDEPKPGQGPEPGDDAKPGQEPEPGDEPKPGQDPKPGHDPKPKPKPGDTPKPVPDPGDAPMELGRVPIGVMLPLRLETRFDAGVLRVRIIPDDLWLSRHDPRPTAVEVDALKRYLERVERGEAERAWHRFATAHGGPRAAWLERTFGPQLRGEVDDPPGIELRPDDRPRFPQLELFPDRLEIWAQRSDGQRRLLTTTAIDHDRLTIDLPMAGTGGGTPDGGLPGTDTSNDTSDDGPQVPDTEPRWWESFDVACKVGLGAVIPLDGAAGTPPVDIDDLDALFVVGISHDSPGGLFADHRDSGLLGTIAPGIPTATVAGEPAAPYEFDAKRWGSLRDEEPDAAQQQLSVLLTGDRDALGALPGDTGLPAGPMVNGLWPALWGFGLGEVLGVGAPGDMRTLGAWAGHALRPQGPLPTLRIGRQPYGLLPVTDLRQWEVLAGEPPLEQGLVGALRKLRELWAVAATQHGNVQGVDAAGLLDRLAQTPTAPRLGVRRQDSLEAEVAGATIHDVLSGLLGWGAGAPLTMAEALAQWHQANPVVASLGITANRHYSGVAHQRPLRLSMFGPDGDVAAAHAALRALVDRSRTEPAALARLDVLERGDGTIDALLLRLALRSLQLALADVARERDGDDAPLLEPATPFTWAPGRLRGLVSSLTPEQLDGDTPALRALRRVTDGLSALADLDQLGSADELDRALRAVIDTASHRLDPWVGAPAWRRIRGVLDVTAREDAMPLRLQLGAFGWVDAPRPRERDPVDGTRGTLLLAPSDGQATTAAILHDRSVSTADAGGPGRWDLQVDSTTARAAERLARLVREGRNLSEAIGAEVERAVGDRSSVAALRRAYPIRGGLGVRRVCDGQRLLEADIDTLDLPQRGREALEQMRAAVDAYGDLLVAEGIHDIVAGRPDAAAAAMDAAAGLAQPPTLDVLTSRREGRAVGSTLLVALELDEELDTSRPGAVADPALARLLRETFGAADAWRWRVEDATGVTSSITLADVGLEPIDALGLPLGQLEALIAADGSLVAHDGSRRYEQARTLIASLGRPARADELADDPTATARPGAADDGAQQLRDRLLALRTMAAELIADLGAAAAAGDDGEDLLTAARRWGISLDGPSDLPPSAERLQAVAQRLQRRLDQAPVSPGASDATDVASVDDLELEDLVEAVRTLASRTGQLAVLTTHRRARLPEQLDPADGFDDDWLPIIAAVRAPCTRREAGRLIATMHGDAERTFSNRPDDPWQQGAFPATSDPSGATPDERRLVVVHTRADLRKAGATTPFAVGMVDHWTETVPDERHTAAGTFEFDAPAARAPQAILLAVPPRVGQEFDGELLAGIVADVRLLARVRMATPDDLGELAAILPTALFPAHDAASVDLHPRVGKDES